MALINGMYIHVTDEKVDYEVEASTHSVENDVDITDTIKRKSVQLSISGKIVNVPAPLSNGGEIIMTAASILEQLRTLQSCGAVIDYSGRNSESGFQIISLSTSHGNDVAGGAAFDMTLCELKTAQNSYTAPTVEDVVEASDAVTEGGDQIPEQGDSTEVWYTTQPGDVVWNLVADPSAVYKNLRRDGQTDGDMGACNWVMEHNPHAFSRPGDFTSMQDYVKILLGYEE